MAIKAKTGICIDCPKGSREQPLVAKRCQKHYWEHRASVNAEKAKKPAKRSHIPKKSAKQLDREIKYAKQRKAWLPLHPTCQARLPGCHIISCQVHHKQGREGELLFDESKWLAVCHKCHDWITQHSREAIEMGLSLKRNN